MHQVHGGHDVLGQKDTLIVLLLDEAQNLLLGNDNSKTEMASSMKKFCGIIRKFNLLLWLISPAMHNLGPASGTTWTPTRTRAT